MVIKILNRIYSIILIVKHKVKLYVATHMAYNKVRFFSDFQDSIIHLSKDVYDNHIAINHPEISKNIIEQVLQDPDEIWISKSREDTMLYFKLKGNADNNRVRYYTVIVKNVDGKLFVSSAMTKSAANGALRIFKKI